MNVAGSAVTRQLAPSDLQSIRSRRLAVAMAGLALVFGFMARVMRDERQREGKMRGELRMLHGDGTAFECELSSSIFLDSDNAPCANIVLHDIIARKRSEARIALLNVELEQRVGRRTAQLEASNRDLQEFAHSVAHDLRRPFIAIGGFSGLLERRVTDDRARHDINRIKAGVRQAGELTEALLAPANLSRVQLRVQIWAESARGEGARFFFTLGSPGI